MGSLVPGVRKIAVLRANSLGDFIFCLPALAALRAAYPAAEIVLLARAWHAQLLAHRPGPVDRVLVMPENALGDQHGVERAAPERLASFLDEARAEHFDLALQLHGGGRNSNPVVLQLGARVTAGLATDDAPRLDRTVPYVYFQNEVLRYLEVVRRVGAVSKALEPCLAVTAADREEASRLLPASSARLVALHPGATDPRRRWSPAAFARVGRALLEQDVDLIVTGGPDEQELARCVLDQMPNGARNLCGQLSLGGLVGALAACDVVVANDTGPLHLAAAVGTSTVGIYWCGNLINGGPLFRTRHRPFASWRLTCNVCGANTITFRCAHEVSFVDEVPVDDVLLATRQLLADRAGA
ncbi:MAG: glycosyltransferase family 9 protein [Chloroflexi bacterium]|nr:glycosyltransferase family 9 protein [Chloroflexota bacterium]